MSLSAALNAARSSLTATSTQTSVVSRNVAGVGDPTYTRKIANLATTLGSVSVVSIGRAADKALFENRIDAGSANAMQQAIADGYDRLELTVNDPDDSRSPAAMLGKLTASLQQYAASPNNTVFAQAVVTNANALAGNLNTATATVQAARSQADADMASSVATINDLLAQFQDLNRAIVGGTQSGADVSDDLDARDKLLTQLSEQIGISVVTRANNDTVIYTDSGATLFERSARTVTFERTLNLSAATGGKAVVVDGVPVTGSSATMPIKSGRLAGLTALRDDVAVKYQSQLDEIARGLIRSFAESDQSATPTKPDATGLFTYSGGPTVPGATLVKGLAGDIRVNAHVDPAQGGSLHLLRDGAISDPSDSDYVYNTAGAASFSDRLQGVIDALGQSRSFDPTSGGVTTGSLDTYAASSVSWLEAGRKDATGQADYKKTLLERSTTALSNATGANLDEEMATMLDLEHAYQASSKLISTVGAMLDALMAAA